MFKITNGSRDAVIELQLQRTSLRQINKFKINYFCLLQYELRFVITVRLRFIDMIKHWKTGCVIEPNLFRQRHTGGKLRLRFSTRDS